MIQSPSHFTSHQTMSYQPPISNPNDHRKPSLYPQVRDSNPEAPINHQCRTSPSAPPPSSNLYPSVDMSYLTENLFPDNKATAGNTEPSAPPQATEETLIKVPGAILHLIDQCYSVELACSDLTIIRLIQDGNVVAVLASVGEEIQWPLTKDIATVKLDDSHYFFSLNFPPQPGSKSDSDFLNYGLTIASKGQGKLLKELDGILQEYSYFSVQRVSENVKELDGDIAMEVAPVEMMGKKKEAMEEKSAAYWTTLAPNVEDYSGIAAKLVAAGSGQLIRGILWCGDVTVERLKWGNEVLKQRIAPGDMSEVSPETLRRIKRVKRVTKMTEKVATGVLSGVVKVSGFFTSSVSNSKAGKKFFNLLPGELVLASLDGFSRLCDAVEVAGKNVMSTSSTVTTELVNHKYGEKAAEATNEGLDAAGHAIGTAWAAFKIRKALNPKSVLKPTTLAKSAAKAAAAEIKGKKSSK